MSFRELTMTDVKEVLRRWTAGQSVREIARESGTDRKTVRRYIDAGKSVGLTLASPLDDGALQEILQRVQSRPLPEPSSARKTIESVRPRIEAWLGAPRALRLVVARALYSLPTQYVGKTVDVRVDSRTVRLYVGAELVKVHPRVAPGKRSTDASDYPSHKAAYALRSVDDVKARARRMGEHVGRYAEQLLGGPLPWTKMRQAYGLLRLCER